MEEVAIHFFVRMLLDSADEYTVFDVLTRSVRNKPSDPLPCPVYKSLLCRLAKSKID